MKRLCLLCIIAALLCSCQSKETKAVKLIEQHLFGTLFDFDSYTPIETVLTEAKSSALNDSTIYSKIQMAIILIERLADSKKEVERIKSQMEIWGPPTRHSSSYAKQQYKKYETQASEALADVLTYSFDLWQLDKHLKDAIHTLDENTIVGWEAIHRFRCKTIGGYSTIGEYRYIIDKEFKNIILCEDLNDDNHNLAREIVDVLLMENQSNEEKIDLLDLASKTSTK